MDAEIIKKIDDIRDQIIDGIRRLVVIDSIKAPAQPDAPFGLGVKKALDQALRISHELRFETVNLDHYMGYALYGGDTLKNQMGDGYVCAIGHVDVVPVGEGWKNPPFSAHMEDGTIYGRGVLDNKGPILCCLYGLYALKELGIQLKHPVRIIFGCDEESGFEDLKYYLNKEAPPLYGFTPDCKYPVVYAERGRAVVRILADKSKLGSFFSFVTNYFIGGKNTGDRLGIDFYHPEYGTMEMRGYELKEEGEKASFQVTLSYPGGFTAEEILEKIREKADGMTAELVMNYDPVIFPKDGAMVSALREAYEKVTGFDGTPVTTTGGTYAKAMPGIVPFGPSFPGQKGIGHNPNEWMKVDDIISNAKIYALGIYRLGML